MVAFAGFLAQHQVTPDKGPIDNLIDHVKSPLTTTIWDNGVRWVGKGTLGGAGGRWGGGAAECKDACGVQHARNLADTKPTPPTPSHPIHSIPLLV
jgi:hypothetical protein